MEEDQAIDPVKLGLCEYQVIEPVDPCHEAREGDDSIIKVSPYEALVINDASKIGATESPFDLKPQQDVITPDQIPCHTLEPHTKGDQILMGPGREYDPYDPGLVAWELFTAPPRYDPGGTYFSFGPILHCRVPRTRPQ